MSTLQISLILNFLVGASPAALILRSVQVRLEARPGVSPNASRPFGKGTLALLGMAARVLAVHGLPVVHRAGADR